VTASRRQLSLDAIDRLMDDFHQIEKQRALTETERAELHRLADCRDQHIRRLPARIARTEEKLERLRALLPAARPSSSNNGNSKSG